MRNIKFKLIFIITLLFGIGILASPVYALENTNGFGVASGFGDEDLWVHYQGNNIIPYEIWNEDFTLDIKNTFEDAQSVLWEVYLTNNLSVPIRTSTSLVFSIKSVLQGQNFEDTNIKIKVTVTENDDAPLITTDDDLNILDTIQDWYEANKVLSISIVAGLLVFGLVGFAVTNRRK